MDPLRVLDDFVITPGVATVKSTTSGFGNILNYFTMWAVAIAGLVTIFVVMPIVPRAPANLIMIICLVALIGGVYLHVNQFGAEYRLATWYNNLQYYGSITMLMLVIFLALGFYYYNTDPAISGALDGMVSRSSNALTSSTRGFRNYAFSGPALGRK